MANPYLYASPEAEDELFSGLERLRLQTESLRAQSTPDMAERFSAIQRENPWMPAGASLPLAKGGYGPGDPITKTVSKGAARRQTRKGWWTRAGEIVRTPIRVAFTVLETPLQEIQGTYRALRAAATDDYTLGEAWSKRGESTGVISLGKILRGEPLSLGQGFFSGGKIREAHERGVKRLKVDDRWISIGRDIADIITEPGTKPFNVLSGLLDAGVALGLDPATYVGGAVGKIRYAKKAFQPVSEQFPRLQKLGLVGGTRKTTQPELVKNFLSGKAGVKIREWLRDTNDFDTLWKGTGKKMPVDVALKLTNAKTDDAVLEILRGNLGITVREAPKIRRGVESVRLIKDKQMYGKWNQNVPKKFFDLDDPDFMVEQLDRLQRAVKMTPETIAKNNRKMAEQQYRNGRLKVLMETLGDVDGVVVTTLKESLGDGLSAAERAKALRGAHDIAKQATRVFSETVDQIQAYAVDEIGKNLAVIGAKIGPDKLPLPTPQLLHEYVRRIVPMPDVRNLKRLTTKYPTLAKGAETPAAFADAFMNEWKTFMLARGAWTVRVVGEEQFRIAASGKISLIRHPLSAIAIMTGKKFHVGFKGKPLEDADEIQKAMTRGSGWMREHTSEIGTNNFIRYARDNDRFVPVWADEITAFHNEPVARYLAANGPAETKTWFWGGKGRNFRKEISEASGREEFLIREGSDRAIDDLARRMQAKTSNDQRLIDAIATGKMDGKRIVHLNDQGKHIVDKSFKAKLQTMYDEGVGPQVVVGEQYVPLGGKGPGKAKQAYDRAVDTFFDWAGAKGTNYASRSPFWKQSYWERGEELIGRLSKEAQAEILANARKAKLPKAQIEKMENLAGRGSGALNIDEAELLAGHHATAATKKTLYDLTERGQFMDAFRLIFPFGEAWKEILTTWARIGMERPQTIRRFQQGIEGARGAGVFYADPTTGEEVFAYPGGQFLTEKLLGVPIKLQGRVGGLNLFATNFFMPGVGPAIQLPAGWIIPDKPQWDWVREAILPFGEIDTEEGVVEGLLPAWTQKLRTAIEDPEQDRIFGNSIGDVATYLTTTGKYDTNTEEGMRELYETAKTRARWLWLMRGIIQFGAPAAPSPAFLAKDKAGNWKVFQAIRDDFKKMQDEDYEAAPQQFLDKYGEDFFMFMQNKSHAVIPGAPVTEQAMDWVRDNPEVERDFPSVYGFFAPQGGDFSITAYARHFKTGAKEALTPEQMGKLANHRVARMIYEQAKAKVGDSLTASERGWLSDLKDALRKDYPGYDQPLGLKEPASTDQMIRELQSAVQNKAIAGTKAGQGLQSWFRARERAISVAQRRNLKTLGGKQLAPTRDWLRDVAQAIIQERPDFAPLYERVLSREIGGTDYEKREEEEEELGEAS